MPVTAHQPTQHHTITFLNKLLPCNDFHVSHHNENHNIDTRQRHNLYLPQANLNIYQKGAYYLGIKIFNNLPLEIKNVAGNQKSLKLL
jgi:hypothetical protein